MHPHPQLFPPPQKQESSRIQMIHSQPSPPPNSPLPHPQLLLQPQPLLRPPNNPPLPPQQDNSRMIQIQLFPHPHPLFWELTHPQESLQPQLVAVKSLILIASKGLFMLYSMHGGLSMFPGFGRSFLQERFLALFEVFLPHMWIKDLHKF